MTMTIEFSTMEIAKIDYAIMWSTQYAGSLLSPGPVARRRVEVKTYEGAKAALIEYMGACSEDGRAMRISARKVGGRQVRNLKGRGWWEDGVTVNAEAVMTDAAKAQMAKETAARLAQVQNIAQTA